MKHGSWPIAFAALVAALPAAAQPVAPERAPPAQQTAPPDKIGRPLHAEQAPSTKARREETTGVAPPALKPDGGKATTPETSDKDTPPR